MVADRAGSALLPATTGAMLLLLMLACGCWGLQSGGKMMTGASNGWRAAPLALAWLCEGELPPRRCDAWLCFGFRPASLEWPQPIFTETTNRFLTLLATKCTAMAAK